MQGECVLWYLVINAVEVCVCVYVGGGAVEMEVRFLNTTHHLTLQLKDLIIFNAKDNPLCANKKYAVNICIHNVFLSKGYILAVAT